MRDQPQLVSDCQFCRSNNLLQGEVIASTDGAYMIAAITAPGNFLIIPTVHREQPGYLPDTWWHDVKALLAHIPKLEDDYNISLNYGATAGQSVRHLHFWIIPRSAGQPAAGKGLARLIADVNSLGTGAT